MSNEETPPQFLPLPFEFKHNITDLKYAVKFGVKFRNIFFGILTSLPLYVFHQFVYNSSSNPLIKICLFILSIILTIVLSFNISKTTLDFLHKKEFISIFSTFKSMYQSFWNIVFPVLGILIIVLFFGSIEWLFSKLSEILQLKFILYGLFYPIHLLVSAFMIYSLIVAIFGIFTSPTFAITRKESQFDRVFNLYSFFWKYWVKMLVYVFIAILLTVLFSILFFALLKNSVVLLDLFYNSNLNTIFFINDLQLNWFENIFFHSTRLLIIGYMVSFIYSGIVTTVKSIEKIN
jgi:hypothetical protein